MRAKVNMVVNNINRAVGMKEMCTDVISDCASWPYSMSLMCIRVISWNYFVSSLLRKDDVVLVTLDIDQCSSMVPRHDRH